VRSPFAFVAEAVSVAVLAACGAAPSDDALVGSPVGRPPPVYDAVGASETVGVGTEDPLREAWPRVFWRTALPDAVYYNFGRSGSTTAEALTEQVPQAVAVDPDVVTVWLNVNDLIALVPPSTYEDQLGSLVGRLRRDGATQVLVATTPRLDSLPMYLACRPSPPPDAPPCPVDFVLPPPELVRAAVDAYNRAIVRVTEREGAILVDLGVFGDAPAEHPEYVAPDGFHPSAEGAAAVAGAFVEAWRRAAPPSVIAGGE